MRICLLFVLNISLLACQPSSTTETEKEQWKLMALPSPASSQSGEPNLFVSEKGEMYLSWIDGLENDTHALSFAKWEGEQWSVPQTIAQDSGWFVNWADFPSLVVHENFMAAHWLAKSAGGTYDYDVKVAVSQDQGKSWSAPFVLHQDGVPAEHGFVSMLPYDRDKVFAIWLDGRFTKSATHEAHGEEHGGAMTLHATTFDYSGNMGEEAELDHRICDCCQTDVVNTDQGLVVVYRDRSEEEIRDIYITRQVNEEWTAPQAVYADQWQLKGCPVNGPAIAAEGQHVAVAWFTAADNTPKVQMAFSDDYGASFSQPVQIDHGKPLGRVDVIVLNDEQMMVSWMEANNEGAEIRAAVLNTSLQLLTDKRIAHTASSRSSGFPIMEKTDEQVYFAWTNVKEESAQIMTAILDMKEIRP
ncbi:sialidase family protein [Catalinimonas niigatensis]|uniref:sialidase family protein n=1 Tax=Catalinimonas niigatensis TaxID=1397264 RepID=UPI002666A271|nr:sialidase family protein [Catalinimonas niigatensis]WPP50182.1 sialidase family protein [Catalinimonas niigatensis]